MLADTAHRAGMGLQQTWYLDYGANIILFILCMLCKNARQQHDAMGSSRTCAILPTCVLVVSETLLCMQDPHSRAD